jgi:hypothetical protein
MISETDKAEIMNEEEVLLEPREEEKKGLNTKESIESEDEDGSGCDLMQNSASFLVNEGW